MTCLERELREHLIHPSKMTEKELYRFFEQKAFNDLWDAKPGMPAYPLKRAWFRYFLLGTLSILLVTAAFIIGIVHCPDTEQIPPQVIVLTLLWFASMLGCVYLLRLCSRQERLYFNACLADAQSALNAYEPRMQQAMIDLYWDSHGNPAEPAKIRAGCLDCGQIYEHLYDPNEASDDFSDDTCPHCGSWNYVLFSYDEPLETFQNLYRFLNDEE